MDAPDLLSVATRHVAEAVAARPDIVAACVGGSVARGDSLPVSDIDLRLITSNPIEPPTPFPEEDVWRDGVHIDCQLVSQTFIARPELYLDHEYIPGFFRHGLVVYDTEGFLAGVLKQLEHDFMAPFWVERRIARRSQDVGQCAINLEAAVAAGDSVGAAYSASLLLRAYTLLPLLVHGQPPCGLRRMGQIARISEPLRKAIAEAETGQAVGTAGLSAALDLLRTHVSDYPNGRAEHAFIQSNWMMDNGLEHETRHVAFSLIGVAVDWIRGQGRATDVPALCRGVLDALGWEGRPTMERKVVLLRETGQLVDEIVGRARAAAFRLPDNAG